MSPSQHPTIDPRGPGPDEVVERFRAAWQAGEAARVEDYLERYPEVAANPDAVLALIKVEFAERRKSEPELTPQEYCRRFPRYEERLYQWMTGCSTRTDGSSHAPAVQAPAPAEPEMPARLGRYRITSRLGSGGFWVVYKAYDEELRREVAIKAPHRERIRRPEDAESYLAEARVVAGLDHEHIVPVFDVGRGEGLCFVVSKFIEGSDLAGRIKQERLGRDEAARLTAAIADALHYAHKRGLVHRDVKPGNILIDRAGKPYLADFGLALKEEDFGRGPGGCGTPAYMSPEQANGEGHRVDGRSDIFSLGIVLYELLAGQRPFRGEREVVAAQIVLDEPRPPRQIDDTIPKELERICLKALAKRASERYTTAKDMADDLRHFLSATSSSDAIGPIRQKAPPAGPLPLVVEQPPAPAAGVSSDARPVKIVPKGLRSFDAHDADFFLELLPGPRDRDGLPDSIRFWRMRIEEADADNTFSVGLLYGPSGCGKSSLVKAGLLPRLAERVIAVYVEATGEETETRLLHGLRKKCPSLPGGLGLKETLAALRRGQGVPAGAKVLIVLDQFEQWLHARREEQNTELVQALRQCDGGRVQCLVLVRDDFWLAVSRFMKDLEVRLLEGQNSALVDLFDPDHARKVLAAFGRAFGRLPEKASELSKEQEDFLAQAVTGLAQENKVICVRLALFAEMMKGRPWSPATLKAVGGAEGVGVTFLEDTFSAATAPPEHRYHQRAARAVLKALLPELGSDIKGNMRSHAQLLAVSGYAKRPKDFEELIRVLDSEIRLITPTEPEGKESAADAAAQAPAGERYYQLTHDYLVPSLRDWLTRKQKETRRGRAELLLADRAAVWNARPERRQLPSFWQWLRIRLLTRKKDWTPAQRKMMRRATRYHVVQSLALTFVLVPIPLLIPYNRRHVARVKDIFRNAIANPAAGKRATYMLADYYADQPEALFDLLVEAHDAETFDVIISRMAKHGDRAFAILRDALQNPDGSGSDLVAGRALVHLGQLDMARACLVEHRVDQSFRVNTAIGLTDQDLVEHYADQPEVLARLLTAASDDKLFDLVFARAKHHGPRALPYLRAVMEKTGGPQVDRFPVARALLMLTGDTELVWPWLGHGANPALRAALIENLGKIGVAPNIVLQRLKKESDVTARRALVQALAACCKQKNAAGPNADEIAAIVAHVREIYRNDPDPGMHGASDWFLQQTQQQDWLKQVTGEWVAGKAQAEARLRRIIREFATGAGAARPAWYVNTVGQTMVAIPGPVEVEIRLPDSEMGAGTQQSSQPGNSAASPRAKTQYKKRIGRSYAVSAKEVTAEEFKEFWRNRQHDLLNAMSLFQSGFEENGVHLKPGATWYDAAAYCNWLSEREGIPKDQWCYERDQQARYGTSMDMKLVADYLHRTGYRLPTEAEWEYAARGGIQGEDADTYAAMRAGKTNAQGQQATVIIIRRPNDFGLLYGYGSEWMLDRYQVPSSAGGALVEDNEEKDEKEVHPTLLPQRVARKRTTVPQQSRSVYHASININADEATGGTGFRTARTLVWYK